MRFRLRFLLQEFDLVGSEVVIGRSPECHVTIEDPLVSRRHARLVIEDDQCTVQDLGSRNGVRVNGRKIGEEPMKVKDGDRIRLGTQELVLSVVDRQERSARTTGFMTVCSSCRTPFPDQARQCPHCGEIPPPRQADETLSGLAVEPRRSWTFQLLGQVIERALATERADEAERILGNAAREVDERIGTGEKMDLRQIEMIAVFALRLAEIQQHARWVSWTLNVHQRQRSLPSGEVLGWLEKLAREGDVDPVIEKLRGYVAWADGIDGPMVPDAAILARLRSLVQ